MHLVPLMTQPVGFARIDSYGAADIIYYALRRDSKDKLRSSLEDLGRKNMTAAPRDYRCEVLS